MYSTPHAKSDNVYSTNSGDKVSRPLHYMNQQMHSANNPSNYVNLPANKINGYVKLQQIDLSKSNYEQLKA